MWKRESADQHQHRINQVIVMLRYSEASAFLLSRRQILREYAQDDIGVSFVVFILTILACSFARAQSVNNPPPSPHEFRAAWVASVGNSNWPSAPGLSVEQQKREMLDILDRSAAMHFNAVILQVRPAADALYNSEPEPW